MISEEKEEKEHSVKESKLSQNRELGTKNRLIL